MPTIAANNSAPSSKTSDKQPIEMKQKTTLILCLLIFSSLSAQVINGGFEVINWNNQPLYWNGVNYPLQVVVDNNGNFKTDSVISYGGLYQLNTVSPYSGQFAFELRNSYNYTRDIQLPGKVFATLDTGNYGGFASPVSGINGRPAALTFYARFSSLKNDTAMASIRLLNANSEEIGYGSLKIFLQNSNYQKMEVPVVYSSNEDAAFAEITFITAVPGTSANLGTSLLIDEVSLNYNTALNSAGLVSPISLYPNPASYDFQVKTQDGSKVKDVVVTDHSGRNVTPPVVSDATAVDVSHLYEGVYIVIVTTGTGDSPSGGDRKFRYKLVIRR